jgi:hypothetical protein
MAKKIPDAAALLYLQALISSGLYTGAQVGLYAANHTPVAGDMAATYTAIEASFGGYARQALGVPSAPVMAGGRATTTFGPPNAWSSTGGGAATQIYGAFVLDASGRLLWAELDPNGPYDMGTAGHAYGYSPVDTLKSEF